MHIKNYIIHLSKALSFFHFRGRINRSKHFILCLFWVCLFLLTAFGLLSSNAILNVILIISTIMNLVLLKIRRSHDINHSGWFALLCLIPFVGSLIALYLFLMPGDKGVNEYGAPEPVNKLFLAISVIALCLFVCSLAVVLALNYSGITAKNYDWHKFDSKYFSMNFTDTPEVKSKELLSKPFEIVESSNDHILLAVNRFGYNHLKKEELQKFINVLGLKESLSEIYKASALLIMEALEGRTKTIDVLIDENINKAGVPGRYIKAKCNIENEVIFLREIFYLDEINKQFYWLEAKYDDDAVMDMDTHLVDYAFNSFKLKKNQE